MNFVLSTAFNRDFESPLSSILVSTNYWGKLNFNKLGCETKILSWKMLKCSTELRGTAELVIILYVHHCEALYFHVTVMQWTDYYIKGIHLYKCKMKRSIISASPHCVSWHLSHITCRAHCMAQTCVVWGVQTGLSAPSILICSVFIPQWTVYHS